MKTIFQFLKSIFGKKKVKSPSEKQYYGPINGDQIISFCRPIRYIRAGELALTEMAKRRKTNG
jgi:hypothetical protein